jgi:hypothetical protein
VRKATISQKGLSDTDFQPRKSSTVFDTKRGATLLHQESSFGAKLADLSTVSGSDGAITACTCWSEAAVGNDLALYSWFNARGVSVAAYLTLAWDIARALSDVLRFNGEVVSTWQESYGFGYDHSYCLIFQNS